MLFHRSRLIRWLASQKNSRLANCSKPSQWPSALLPGECLCCKDSISPPNHCLCDPCIEDLPWLGSHCRQCALPFAGATAGALCADCQQSPPAFRRCIASFEYQPPISPMIKRIKIDAYAPQLRQLSELLAANIAAAYDSKQRPDIIIPVPLHWSRQLRRSFNQSQGIAQSSAAAT